MNKHLSILAFFFFFSFPSLSAQYTMSGVARPADGEYAYASELGWEAFQSRNKALSDAGFGLVDVETVRPGRKRQYWGIWKKEEPAATLALAPGWDSLVMLKRLMAADTFLMIDMEAFVEAKEEWFLAVWVPGGGLHKVRKLNSWEGLMNDHEELGRQNLHLVDIEGYEAADKAVYYLAIYHSRPENDKTYLFRAPELESFQTDNIYRNKSQHYLFDYEQFEKRGVSFYLGLYQYGLHGDVLLNRMEKEAFEDKRARLEEEGMVVVDIEIFGEEEK